MSLSVRIVHSTHTPPGPKTYMDFARPGVSRILNTSDLSFASISGISGKIIQKLYFKRGYYDQKTAKIAIFDVPEILEF